MIYSNKIWRHNILSPFVFIWQSKFCFLLLSLCEPVSISLFSYLSASSVLQWGPLCLLVPLWYAPLRPSFKSNSKVRKDVTCLLLGRWSHVFILRTFRSHDICFYRWHLKEPKTVLREILSSLKRGTLCLLFGISEFPASLFLCFGTAVK